MRSHYQVKYISLGLLIGVFLPLLPGCGDGGYESDEDFVNSVRRSQGSSVESDGTIPSIEEPMDNVAKIRIETTDLDLGLVPNDKIHHQKLKVYNDGKMPLKITKIDTTCACTMGYVTPENAVVPPGGESWIDVTLEPNRVPGFTSHKVLTITSTDPTQAQVQVDVRATIDPEFFIEGNEIVLGDIQKGEVVERRLRLRQLQDSPMTVSGVEVLTLGPTAPKVPGIEARAEAIPEDQWQVAGKREYNIVVSTTPELSAGAFTRHFVVLNDTRRVSRFHMSITGTVLAPYTVTPIYPERVTLQPENAESLVARAIFSATAPVSLAVAATSNPDLSATVVPGVTPNEARIAIQVPRASVPRKPFDETVSVQVTVDGKTFTEIVGVRNAGNAEASGRDDHSH